jgi:hypothetical protein
MNKFEKPQLNPQIEATNAEKPLDEAWESQNDLNRLSRWEHIGKYLENLEKLEGPISNLPKYLARTEEEDSNRLQEWLSGAPGKENTIS